MKNLKRISVCVGCLSPDIIDPNCDCCHGNYKTIILEFEECECCGNINHEPADTEFNTKQLESLNSEGS